MSLAETAKSGDRAQTLRVLRDYIAQALDDTDSARDKASLSKRLMEILTELESLPDAKEVSPADALAERRAARRATASNKSRT